MNPRIHFIGGALAELAGEIRSNASWLYWIGGLTLVNTVLVHVNAPITFALGLMASLVADSIAAEGTIPLAIAIVFDLILVGLCGLFGFFACKAARWAFIAGIVLFAADSLLLIPMFIAGEPPLMATAIHAWALFSLVKGLLASHKFAKLSSANPFTA